MPGVSPFCAGTAAAAGEAPADDDDDDDDDDDQRPTRARDWFRKKRVKLLALSVNRGPGLKSEAAPASSLPFGHSAWSPERCEC